MGYITPSGSNPNYTEAELVNMVKTRMDEIDHNAIIEVGTIDNYPITLMVETTLNECRIDVLASAPLSMLPKAKKTYSSSDVTAVSSIDAGKIVLPDDYLRMVTVESTGWNIPVTSLHTADSLVMARQNYSYARATKKTPAVVIMDETTFVLFPYSSSNSITIYYVSAYTDYDELGEKAADALCWDCAAKVFAALGMSENYARCMELYNASIGARK